MGKSNYLFQIYFWAAFIAMLLGKWAFNRHVKQYMQQQKPLADAAFWQSSLQVGGKGIAFDPNTVRVLDEKEQFEGSHFGKHVYILERVARNDAGDYFWFRFRTDAPLILKPIDQATARVLLKEKYLPMEAESSQA